MIQAWKKNQQPSLHNRSSEREHNHITKLEQSIIHNNNPSSSSSSSLLTTTAMKNSSPIYNSNCCTDTISSITSSTLSQTNDLNIKHVQENVTKNKLQQRNNYADSEFKCTQSNDRGQKVLKKQIIRVMLKQEGTTYACNDFFYSSQPTKLLIHPKKQNIHENTNEPCGKGKYLDPLHSPKSSSSTVTTTSESTNSSISSSDESTTQSPSSLTNQFNNDQSKKKIKFVDTSCRRKICEWIYRLMTFFNIDRETVYYSVSYLDRFMMHYKTDRHTYKLLATTALFLALKVHHPRKLVLNNVVSDLSKGEFDMKDVDRMEIIMLGTLRWSLYPPTPMNFVAHLFDLQQSMIQVLNKNLQGSLLIPNDDTDNHDSSLIFNVEKIQAFTIFFVELSVFDYYFVTQKQSRIALAAIMNSIEGLGLFEAIQLSQSLQMTRLFYTIISSMIELVGMDIQDSESYSSLLKMRKRLWKLYQNSDEMSNNDNSFFRRREDGDVHVHMMLISTQKRF